MNTPYSAPSPRPHVRPRLTCRVVRAWCVVSGNRARHLAACADCQAHFAANAAWEEALRHDARRARETSPAASATLERRILQAAKNAAKRKPARPFTWHRGLAIASMSAAAAAAAIAISVSLQRPSAPPVDSHPPGTAADAALIVDAVENISNQFVDEVLPSAGALVAQNPLQQEIGAVYSDLRSAIDFLALNFLPSAESNPESRPTRTI